MKSTTLKCLMFTLAEFSMATESKKKEIINKLVFPKYQLRSYHVTAKNKLVQSLEQGYDLSPINLGLNYIRYKNYAKDWEKENSLKTLINYQNLVTHNVFFAESYIFQKNMYPPIININGLDIYVKPEIIIKEIREGKTHIGALMINISREKKHSAVYGFCKTIIYEYLKLNVAEGELIDSNMIYFYTPLNSKIIRANMNLKSKIEQTTDEFFMRIAEITAA